MNIGIDKISFATTSKYIMLDELAKKRNIDSLKYTKGLMQEEMSICDNTENVITIAIKSCNEILTNEDKNNIDYIIFATETGIDNSKAASIILQNKLNINKNCRSIEIKQACYGATAALNLAYNYISNNMKSKVLIVASDIAKYGINNAGEPTQGVGAIAMLVSANPKIAVIENKSVYMTRDVWDFYRPINEKYPIVDGKLSIDTYLGMYNELITDYFNKYNQNINDFKAICYHIPYSKLGYKSLQSTLEKYKDGSEKLDKYLNAIKYNKRVGNIYTGSLYLNLLGMITFNEFNENDRIGMYSYGSGAVAEFFTLKLVKGYKQYIKDYTEMLNNREKVSIEKYEQIFFDDRLINYGK